MTVSWDGSGNDYAQGNFYLGVGDECEGWLERDVYSNGSWSGWFVESGIHSLSPIHQSTDPSWDGTNYLARACVGDSTPSGSHSCGASC